MDVGAPTPPLWGFEEREKLMGFTNVPRALACTRTIFVEACIRTYRQSSSTTSGRSAILPQGLRRHRGLADGNRIFKQRNVGIAEVKLADAWGWGFCVMVRGSGAAWDLRKAQPYECYSELDFDIPIGKNGDCYDRYLVRMEEMRQSVRIMKQCLEKLRLAEGQGWSHHQEQQDRAAAARNEALHGGNHPPFQALQRGHRVPAGEVYAAVEAPKVRFVASTWSRTAPTGPTGARFGHPHSPICRRWTS